MQHDDLDCPRLQGGVVDGLDEVGGGPGGVRGFKMPTVLCDAALGRDVVCRPLGVEEEASLVGTQDPA